MKKFLMAILSFLLILCTSQVYAYTLVGDVDDPEESPYTYPFYRYSPDDYYWDDDDSNPDLLNRDSEASETAWLQSLLGETDVAEFYSKDEGPDGEGPVAFEDNWTYAVLKFGTGSGKGDDYYYGHVAIMSELVEGVEEGDFPFTKTILANYLFDVEGIEDFGEDDIPDKYLELIGPHGISHVTYFNHVSEPATMLLLGTGLIGLGIVGRKRFIK